MLGTVQKKRQSVRTAGVTAVKINPPLVPLHQLVNQTHLLYPPSLPTAISLSGCYLLRRLPPDREARHLSLTFTQTEGEHEKRARADNESSTFFPPVPYCTCDCFTVHVDVFCIDIWAAIDLTGMLMDFSGSK